MADFVKILRKREVHIITVKFTMSNYTQFKLFLIISIGAPTQYIYVYIVNLKTMKTMKLNNLIQENAFDSNLLLLNTYVNMNDVYFEINNKNELIYILTHMEVRNNKILFNLRDSITLVLSNNVSLHCIFNSKYKFQKSTGDNKSQKSINKI